MGTASVPVIGGLRPPILIMHKTCRSGQGKKLAGRTAVVAVVVVVVVAGEVEGATKEVELETTCAFRLMISFFEVSFTTFLKGSGHKRGGGGNRGGGGGRNSARAHASASVSVNVNANAYASSGGGGGNRSPSRGGGGRLSYNGNQQLALE